MQVLDGTLYLTLGWPEVCYNQYFYIRSFDMHNEPYDILLRKVHLRCLCFLNDYKCQHTYLWNLEQKFQFHFYSH